MLLLVLLSPIYAQNQAANILKHQIYTSVSVSIQKTIDYTPTLMVRYPTKRDFPSPVPTPEDSVQLQSNNQHLIITEQRQEVATLQSQRNLLILLSGLLLLGLLVLTGLLFRKNKRKKLVERDKQTEQRLLRAQMNPHFIFNSISVIQSLILAKENKEAINYLNKFSRLMRVILEGTSHDFISLDKELAALNDYVTLQSIRFNDAFDFHLKIEESIDTETILVPPMLLQPFVENAIEHGIRNMEDGKISVHIYKKDKHLYCVIEDNGIGLVAGKKQKTLLDKKAQSASTQLTRERLMHFGKTLNTPVELSIRDKRGDGTQGTRVSMIIPFKFI